MPHTVCDLFNFVFAGPELTVDGRSLETPAESPDRLAPPARDGPAGPSSAWGNLSVSRKLIEAFDGWVFDVAPDGS